MIQWSIRGKRKNSCHHSNWVFGCRKDNFIGMIKKNFCILLLIKNKKELRVERKAWIENMCDRKWIRWTRDWWWSFEELWKNANRRNNRNNQWMCLLYRQKGFDRGAQQGVERKERQIWLHYHWIYWCGWSKPHHFIIFQWSKALDAMQNRYSFHNKITVKKII